MMIYKNTDQRAFSARDKELWNPPECKSNSKKCEICGKTLYQGYYNINDFKLCEQCAKLEFKECFNDFEDLEKLKQIREYDSIEQLIIDTVDEELYKFWVNF